MFKGRILKVINTIKEGTIFQDTGFLKDTKTQGGFLGITDEYINYFYARIEAEDAEGDPYTFAYVDSKRIEVNFTFKLVFSIVKDIESFDIFMMNRINKVPGVKVVGFDDVTESIYLRETGETLKNENFTLYSYSCEYSKETVLSNLVNCIDGNLEQLFC